MSLKGLLIFLCVGISYAVAEKTDNGIEHIKLDVVSEMSELKQDYRIMNSQLTEVIKFVRNLQADLKTCKETIKKSERVAKKVRRNLHSKLELVEKSLGSTKKKLLMANEALTSVKTALESRLDTLEETMLHIENVAIISE